MLHVVLDCREPEALAKFWALALGYRVARSEGVFVILVPERREDPGPPFLLQRVSEPKAGKNRMHVDLPVDDVEETARTLVAAGATRVSAEPMEELGARWITLADPDGNEFDVVMSASSEGG
jgi:predicted enzyme related to lactoylglutathione lyase